MPACFHAAMLPLLSALSCKSAMHPADSPLDFHSPFPGMALSMPESSRHPAAPFPAAACPRRCPGCFIPF